MDAGSKRALSSDHLNPAAPASPTPASPTPASPQPVREPHPPLTGRVYYLVGGTLPPQYSSWVSHDLTSPRWRVRQASRLPLLMVPFAIVFALLPGRLDVRLTISIFLLAAAVGLGFATAGHFRNRRLVQHGFPPVVPPEEDEAIDQNPANRSRGMAIRAASDREPETEG